MKETGRSGWWIWVAVGVAWGLLCVGVRHAALRAGMKLQDLVAERHECETRVQTLERRVDVAGQLERLEQVAAGYGFVRPPPAQLVIVPPEAEEGLLSRILRKLAPASDVPPAGKTQALNIRSREEVVVDNPRIVKKTVKRHKRARGKR